MTWTITYVVDPTAAFEQNLANENKAQALEANWGVCPGAQPPGAGGVPPQQTAANYWASQGSNPLLTPAPRIQPGWAATGKTAYLETGGRTGQAFQDPTGGGVLRIQAAGQFYVDWGDGTGRQGPFNDPGGPYPDGTITHTWTTTGTFTVQVFEFWTATWTLGGRTGQLTGLRTVGTIPNFPVKELVSVRNR
ncbi:MAG TPA: hypothetical protein VGR90_07130 [Acidimicrobiales bacterium]|nr:hypothetical protein [Acidimicrobiales bacterium]